MSGSEDGFNLMLDHFFYCISGWFQVVAGVKVGRIFVESFSDSAGHGQTDIGVDINFADCMVAAFLSMSSGTPLAPSTLPPYWLHFSTNSGITVEAPWRTMG